LAAYDLFADFYSRGWGEHYHAQLPGVLFRLLEGLAPFARILDVGCGDGRVAALLSERGFRVTGIDESAGMIDHARRRAPSAEFFVRRAHELEGLSGFDAALATFESLNHVLEAEELAACFIGVGLALKEQGRLVFDLNDEIAYTQFWNGSFELEQGGETCRLVSSFNPSTGIAACELTLSERTFTIRQRCYPEREVLAMLSAAGFVSIESFDSRQLGMSGDHAVARTFYRCWKP